jgi:hypothetical protein
MARNTSVYWKSEEIAEQARQIADAKGISVSQLVSDLIAETYINEFEPPLFGTCPTCHQETTFVFLALWDGLPGREAFKLYRCEACKTTLGEGSLANVNAVVV